MPYYKEEEKIYGPGYESEYGPFADGYREGGYSTESAQAMGPAPQPRAMPQPVQRQHSSLPPVRGGAGGSATGQSMQGMGTAAMSVAPMTGPAAPWIAGGGAVLSGVGTVLDMKAKQDAADQAKEEYQMLLDEWNRRKAREQADYDRELDRQEQADAYYGAAQSAALEDRFAGSYGGYRAGGQ